MVEEIPSFLSDPVGNKDTWTDVVVAMETYAQDIGITLSIDLHITLSPKHQSSMFSLYNRLTDARPIWYVFLSSTLPPVYLHVY